MMHPQKGFPLKCRAYSLRAYETCIAFKMFRKVQNHFEKCRWSNIFAELKLFCFIYVKDCFLLFQRQNSTPCLSVPPVPLSWWYGSVKSEAAKGRKKKINWRGGHPGRGAQLQGARWAHARPGGLWPVTISGCENNGWLTSCRDNQMCHIIYSTCLGRENAAGKYDVALLFSSLASSVFTACLSEW